MKRKNFIQLLGVLTITSILPKNMIAQSLENPYLTEFEALPSNYKRKEGAHLIDGAEAQREKDFWNTRLKLTDKYSWGVPTEEAVKQISMFTDSVIDFGAGSGYWAYLLKQTNVDVIAVDNWEAGKPDKLWIDVKTGSYEYLKMTSGRTLFMCWIPQYSDMGLTALKTWNGDKFIMVGEDTPARSNANPEFFKYLYSHYELVKMINIPQWYNHRDAVFFYRKIK